MGVFEQLLAVTQQMVDPDRRCSELDRHHMRQAHLFTGRNRNVGWTTDNIYITNIAYADDISLLAPCKEDLELMEKECIAGFDAAGLEIGMNKTLWSEKITYVGAQIHLCSNSGSAMTKRLQKAKGVFEKWSNILCDTTLDLTQTNPLLQSVSALQSRMAERLLDPLQKDRNLIWLPWRARLHARMLGARMGSEEDIGSFLDANAQKMTSLHETTLHFSCEHVPNTEAQDGCLLRTA